MKKIFFLLLITQSLLLIAYGQAPEKFKYQAVARDGQGNLISDKTIGLKVFILKGSETGETVYCEIHTVKTNSYGLFSVNIGEGGLVVGPFSKIDWGNDKYYIKTSIDETGGATYEPIGTAQLLSVPYALYAEKSGTAGPTGATGSKGDTGPQGEQGIKGATGNFLTQKMTEQERNAILNPAEGLVVINTTTQCLNYYLNSYWYEVCGAITIAQPIPTSNSPVCNGDTLKFEVSEYLNATYLWTGPNNFISNLRNPVIPNASDVCGGTYKVVVSIGNNSRSNTTDVLIKPIVGNLSITITATNNNICPDPYISIHLTSITTNGGTNPGYQWKKNNTNIGSNSPECYASGLADFDKISCELISSEQCAVPKSVTSNIITARVKDLPSTANAGPDQILGQGPSVNLAANTPKIGTGSWSILNGTGGSFKDITDPLSTFTGVEKEIYKLQWKIQNECGSSDDDLTVVFKITGCGNNFTDSRDKRAYKTVQIYNQCWMAENLDIGTFVTSNNTGLSHSDVTDNSKIEKYCYNNLVANCKTYGGLYDWREAVNYTTGTEDICPANWHLPSRTEFQSLEDYLGASSGPLKTVTGWNPPNFDASNSTGFSALPAGSRNDDGSFGGLLDQTFYWSSSTSGNPNIPVYLILTSNMSGSSLMSRIYVYGSSVRCLMD